MTNSPSSVSKRKPGRPPKFRSDSNSGLGVQGHMPNVQPNNASHASPPTDNSAPTAKRGRGRPPKVGATNGHATVSGGGKTQGSGNPASKPKVMGSRGNKSGRGRPKRIGIAPAPVSVPLSRNVLRPRGRANGAVNGGVGKGSRSGRPSAIDIAKLIEKTVGKLNKVGPGTVMLVTDPSQLVVYQELRTKYQLLQSKVKQVANVIKPIIESGNHVLDVIQEAEALAGTGATEPFPQN